ncbi:MAG: hypothetical protein H6559_33395 [Lewinellaceae bacterium]|nr:hypothetical protein [Lewinellaceae bacterium]
MKSTTIKYLAFGLTLLFPALSFAQDGKDVQQVQPTIMVVPWTSKGEDIRQKLDEDFTYRAVLSKIKEAFDYRRFTTYDFITAYQNAEIEAAQDWTAQSSLFKEIANNSPADMYVKADIDIHQGGSGARVHILMEAVDNYSDQSLANTSVTSRTIRTTDYTLLAQQALDTDNETDRFLELLNSKFADIRENGRTIEVRIVVDENSEVDLETEAGDDYDYLGDLIEDWLKENAHQNYAHKKGGDETFIHFDAVKIPLRDEDGNNYDASRFARELRKQVAKLGAQTEYGSRLRISQDIRGASVTLTIKTE